VSTTAFRVAVMSAVCMEVTGDGDEVEGHLCYVRGDRDRWRHLHPPHSSTPSGKTMWSSSGR
jgi:hypothetical protein